MTNEEIIKAIREQYGDQEFYGKQVRRELLPSLPLHEIVAACDEAVEQGAIANPYRNPRGNYKFIEEK